MHARRLVRAVLAPHHAEDTELGESGLASAQKLLDLVEFVGREAVLPDELWSQGYGWGRIHRGSSIVAYRQTPWKKEFPVLSGCGKLYWHVMKSVIVGTAGHIDHGKTALVKALTGIDADRLEEEKRC